MKNVLLPALMTIADFSRWARIGRTRIYEEVASGFLPTVKIGRRTYIRTVDAQAWLDHYVRTPGTMPELRAEITL